MCLWMHTYIHTHICTYTMNIHIYHLGKYFHKELWWWGSERRILTTSVLIIQSPWSPPPHGGGWRWLPILQTCCFEEPEGATPAQSFQEALCIFDTCAFPSATLPGWAQSRSAPPVRALIRSEVTGEESERAPHHPCDPVRRLLPARIALTVSSKGLETSFHSLNKCTSNALLLGMVLAAGDTVRDKTGEVPRPMELVFLSKKILDKQPDKKMHDYKLE